MAKLEYNYDTDMFKLLDTYQIRSRLNAQWLANSVKSILLNNYHSKDVLPILADALEEAGCNDDDLLLHLRWGHPGERVSICNVARALFEFFTYHSPVGRDVKTKR